MQHRQQTPVSVFSFSPVRDFNQITFHMLDVMHTHWLNTHGAQQFAPQQAQGSSAAAAYTQQPQHLAPVGQQQLQPQQQQQQQHQQPQGDANILTPLQRQVLTLFERSPAQADERGTGVDDIRHMMPTASEAEIRKAIEVLSSEGHLYSTTDEEHYKTTSG